MKNLNKLIYFFSIVSLFLLSSCLTDDKVEDMEYGILIEQLEANKILEFPVISHVKSLPVLIEGAEAVVNVGEVHLAAKEVAQEDITVNLNIVADRTQVLSSVRSLLANRFPSDGKAPVADEDILSFPGSSITVPTSVTIPKGESSVNVDVKIKTDAIKAASAFVVVNIESAVQDGYLVSGNFGQLLLDIKIKSAYEGNYIYNCISAGPYNKYMGYIDNGATITLSTVSPTIVETLAFTGLFGTGDWLQYEFNANSEIVGISWPAFAAINPLKIIESTYDKATKTTYVKYYSDRSGIDKPFEETFQKVD